MSARNWKVGDTIWYVPNGKNEAGVLLRIVLVGRKWLTAVGASKPDDHWSRIRFDPITLLADGGRYTSPGQAYESCAKYEDELKLDTNWRRLRVQLDPYRRPKWATAKAMAAIERILSGEDP